MKFTMVSLAVTLCVGGACGSGIVGCYYDQKAIKRPGIGKFGVSDLPINLCTEIYYSFATVHENGQIKMPPEVVSDGKSNHIADLIALKKKNADLKIFLTIAGTYLSVVCNNNTLRSNFVSHLVSILVKNKFDGLAIDWEFPGDNGNKNDKKALVWLLRDLKKEFAPHKLLLNCAVGAHMAHMDFSYDVPNMIKYVDYIHLMTYDYHGPWDTETGVNAPLYAQETDPASCVRNVNSSVNTWMSKGAIVSKLVMGLGSFARTFKLKSLHNVSTGAPTNGSGAPGKYTKKEGYLSYYELCQSQKEHKWSITNVKNNYVYGNFGTFWAGYDDTNTIYKKAQYAKKKGLAGVMFWAVDIDDFRGLCGEKYPLIEAACKGFLQI